MPSPRALSTPSPSPHTKTRHSLSKSPKMSSVRSGLFQLFFMEQPPFQKISRFLPCACHVIAAFYAYQVLGNCKLTPHQLLRQLLGKVPFYLYIVLIMHHNPFYEPIHYFLCKLRDAMALQILICV